MTQTLILGYGNPLCGDDAVGAVIAARLARQFANEDSVDVKTVHQLTPDLASSWGTYEKVILVDAHAGAVPGKIVREVVTAEAPSRNTFTHYVRPGQLLHVARVLFAASPEVVLLGVTANSFGAGCGMSTAVRAALPYLLDMVAQELRPVRTGASDRR